LNVEQTGLGEFVKGKIVLTGKITKNEQLNYKREQFA
jgi:hypothetical protein